MEEGAATGGAKGCKGERAELTGDEDHRHRQDDELWGLFCHTH